MIGPLALSQPRAPFGAYVAKKVGCLWLPRAQVSFVADTNSCEVLPVHVARLLPSCARCSPPLSARSAAALELAWAGCDGLRAAQLEPIPGRSALLRPSPTGTASIVAAAQGPETAHPFTDAGSRSITPCRSSACPRVPATEFTQVNMASPRAVKRAVDLLDPQPASGWGSLLRPGHFSLALATRGATVVGWGLTRPGSVPARTRRRMD